VDIVYAMMDMKEMGVNILNALIVDMVIVLVLVCVNAWRDTRDLVVKIQFVKMIVLVVVVALLLIIVLVWLDGEVMIVVNQCVISIALIVENALHLQTVFAMMDGMVLTAPVLHVLLIVDTEFVAEKKFVLAMKDGLESNATYQNAKIIALVMEPVFRQENANAFHQTLAMIVVVVNQQLNVKEKDVVP
jgi:hypothetical protein